MNKDTCRINEAYDFSCDIISLASVGPDASIEELRGGKNLFRGDFMEGMYLKNCNEFNEMVLFERVVCQTRQLALLEQLSDKYEKRQMWEEALMVLNEISAIEPYNERFCAKRMKLLCHTGNRAKAVKYYREFENSLRRDLAINPERELVDLYKKLRDGTADCPKKEDSCPSAQEPLVIEVEFEPVEGISYLALTEILTSLLENAGPEFLTEIPFGYLEDLFPLSRELMLACMKSWEWHSAQESNVMPARMILSFEKVLGHILIKHQVHVIVRNAAILDAPSRAVLRRLDEKWERFSLEEKDL